MSAIGSLISSPISFLRKYRESAPVTKTFSEEQEISKRSGVLWKCINRSSDKSGGYIYTLRYRKKYDHQTFNDPERLKAAQAKALSIFPAVEPVSISIPYLDPRILVDSDLLIKPLAKQRFRAQYSTNFENNPSLVISDMTDAEKIEFKKNMWKTSKADHIDFYQHQLRNYIQHHEILKQLGYTIERRTSESKTDSTKGAGVFVQLPDEVVLTARWNDLRQNFPDLPQLHILKSDGIAGDMEFVQAFLDYSALLSSAGEFCHDHFFHVIPVIIALLSYGLNAVEERNRLRGIVSIIFDKIAAVKKLIESKKFIVDHPKDFLLLQASAGIIADASSSVSSISTSQERFPSNISSEEYIKRVFTSPKNLPSLRRRPEFAAVEILPERILQLWKEIEEHF